MSASALGKVQLSGEALKQDGNSLQALMRGPRFILLESLSCLRVQNAKHPFSLRGF